ncbi:DUF7513 family protein [Halocatena halophila]|uniref:DUF7513 family protein n=1 Tax=Halocatena halophila TaxID=2814576 RepID=UPI002ED22FEF
MSLLEKYLKGWQFRTNTPAFEPGESVELFVFDVIDGTPVASVGDTKLFIEDAPPELAGSRAIVEITSFDDQEHTGSAKLLERLHHDAVE